MPQLSPIYWLFLYLLVWSTILGVMMELFWLQAPIKKTYNKNKIAFLHSPKTSLFSKRDYSSNPWLERVILCPKCELTAINLGPCVFCSYGAYIIHHKEGRFVVYKCQTFTCPRSNWWMDLNQCTTCKKATLRLTSKPSLK